MAADPHQAPPGDDVPRLLLVDDDDDLIEILSRRFRKRGFSVTVAGDGAEALQAARNDQVGVALIDSNLPHMDGLHLLTHLKQHDGTIQVILLTGTSDPQAVRSALDAGAFAYLVKPCPFDQMEATVRNAWNKRQREADSAGTVTPIE